MVAVVDDLSFDCHSLELAGLKGVQMTDNAQDTTRSVAYTDFDSPDSKGEPQGRVIIQRSALPLI
jgi:hypothetical protein